MKILITGATGFVGSFLIQRLLREDVRLIAAVLDGEPDGHLPVEVERVIVKPLSESSDYSMALLNVDTVIHLAARVHVMRDTATDTLQEFRRVNLHGTERLAIQAAQAGVKRFVFISSVKVHGEETETPYIEDSRLVPLDPYGTSKAEAEKALRRVAGETGLEVVIVRPPLVYGPGVKANFLQLMSIVRRGVPLPLASIQNRRSLIFVGNLADALTCCAIHANAAGRTYLVSDGEDVSTPVLIQRLASSLRRPNRLFPFPPALIRLAGTIMGKRAAANRLLGSLAVDSSKIRHELGWQPPFTMEQGLIETAKWYKKTTNRWGMTHYLFNKRLFDICLSLLSLLLFAIPMLIVAILVRLTSPGPVLYWSDRVGHDNLIFKMPKFRTMLIDTPPIATHLLGDPDRWLTPIGKSLRKTSLDELPQLLSILKGDMSIVGPRPALFNQDDLIALRTEKGVHRLTPGLTGWAQINGRDELPIPDKVEFDVYYLNNRSLFLDIQIILRTLMKVMRSEGVTH